MKTGKNIFSTLLTLLLILQMGTAFALPPGSHLELCFGPDGHFDISPDTCRNHLILPQQQAVSQSSGIHHGDCIDLAIGCGPDDHAVLSNAGSGIGKTTIRVLPCLPAALPAGIFARPLPWAEFHPSFPANGITTSPPHLVSLRTIVLVI
jgi:hypothetical protein